MQRSKLQGRYVKGVPFVNRWYMKGVQKWYINVKDKGLGHGAEPRCIKLFGVLPWGLSRASSYHPRSMLNVMIIIFSKGDREE